jgi:uncharacterized membrane protein
MSTQQQPRNRGEKRAALRAAQRQQRSYVRHIQRQRGGATTTAGASGQQTAASLAAALSRLTPDEMDALARPPPGLGAVGLPDPPMPALAYAPPDDPLAAA